jgi:hypothetical protein
MASVWVRAKALTDTRYETLGRRLGINRYEAMGRMLYVWSQCTEESSEVLDAAALDGILGADNAGEALVAARLATKEDNERYRVKGTGPDEDGHKGVHWLEAKRTAGSKGGRAKAAKAAAAKQNASTDLAPAKQGASTDVAPGQQVGGKTVASSSSSSSLPDPDPKGTGDLQTPGRSDTPKAPGGAEGGKEPLPFTVKDLLSTLNVASRGRVAIEPFDSRLAPSVTAVIREMQEQRCTLDDARVAGEWILAGGLGGKPVAVGWIATTGKLLDAISKARAWDAAGRPPVDARLASEPRRQRLLPGDVWDEAMRDREAGR